MISSRVLGVYRGQRGDKSDVALTYSAWDREIVPGRRYTDRSWPRYPTTDRRVSFHHPDPDHVSHRLDRRLFRVVEDRLYGREEHREKGVCNRRG